MKKIVLLCLFCILFSSCTGKRVVDVKSPCVSTEDGPCGPRRPVNDWWLKKNVNSYNLS